MSSSSGELTSGERERLTDEREHLLASLDDLDAERAAGDIDEADFRTLHDDYTARAAQLTRARDAGVVRRRAAAGGSGGRRLAWIGVVLVVALGAAWAMAEFSGARGRGETASGEIRQSTTSLLADAAAAFGAGDSERSIELYDEVLDLQPTNVEALTYRGWVKYQLGDTTAAEVDFAEAVAFDPDYADVRVFTAVAALDAGAFEVAAAELDAFDDADPTAIARQLVQQRQLRERIATGRVLDVIESAEGIPDFPAAGVALEEAQLAGEILLQLEQPTNALITFDGILASEPDNAPAMAWRGWTLAITAESGAEALWPEAERWLAAAVDADPSYPDARVFRAFVFRRLDRIDEARAELVAFDSLAEQPDDMLALVDDFGLREAVGLG